MLKKYFYIFILAIVAIVAVVPMAAQTQTAVSATITDPSGIPYANGTYSIQLIPTGNNPSVGGAAIQGAFNGSLSATGSFSASLWPNSSITPASTQWSFTICSNSGGIQPPLGTGTQCTPPTAITISGTAQVLTTTLSNVAPKLTNFITGGTGSVTSVAATSPIVATPSPITGAGTLSCPTCSVLAPNTPGIPTNNGPLLIYASNYGVKAQGVRWADASWGSGANPTVTVAITTGNADAPFTAAMVGWNMFGTNSPITQALATARSVLPVGTITSFISATQVGVTPGSAATACSSTTSIAACQFFAAPNDDQPALLAAANAAFLPNGVTSSPCGTLILPQGYMWVSQKIANNNWHCDAFNAANGSSYGATVTGCGMYCSVLVPAPNTTAGAWNTGSSQANFFYTTGDAGQGWHYRGFSVDGMGQVAALSPQPRDVFFLNQNSDVEDVGVFQWGSVNGIEADGSDAAEAIVDRVYIVAAGTNCGLMAGQQAKVTNSAFAWNIGIGNACYQGFRDASSGNTYDNAGGSNNLNLLSGCGLFQSVNDMVLTQSATGNFINDACTTAFFTNLYVHNANATNTVGIASSSGTSLYLSQSKIDLTTGTGTKALNIAGNLFDQGGNVIKTVAANSITGAYIGQGSTTFQQTIVTAAQLVLSAGWGSTAANTALSGGNSPIGFTITNSGTGQAATPTITYTFPTPYQVAPLSCTATQTGGTNPLLNPFTSSSLTATGVTFAATGTPTVNDTEIMQVACVIP